MFVSSQQGDGLQDLYSIIDSMFTPADIKALEDAKKLRRQRFDLLRDQMVKEITDELKKKDRQVDIGRLLLL